MNFMQIAMIIGIVFLLSGGALLIAGRILKERVIIESCILLAVGFLTMLYSCVLYFIKY